MRHDPHQQNLDEVIMISKPNKPPDEEALCRPIFYIANYVQIYVKLLLKRLKRLVEARKLIQEQQDAFREKFIIE